MQTGNNFIKIPYFRELEADILQPDFLQLFANEEL